MSDDLGGLAGELRAIYVRLAALEKAQRESLHPRQGVVDAVGAATIDVTIGDTTETGVPVFGALPVVGEMVWLWEWGPDRALLCLPPLV